jgi:hypothetical protein
MKLLIPPPIEKAPSTPHWQIAKTCDPNYSSKKTIIVIALIKLIMELPEV